MCVATFLIAYTITLASGLISIESSAQPIADPLFSILELLIIVMMPPMVALIVAVHAWAPVEAKTLSLTALCFMSLLAGMTSGVHFVILILSRQADFAQFPQLFSFKWPSVVYALDIFAWDVLFALSMLFAAPIFGGTRLATTIRVFMTTSGVLALAGVGGAVVGDMRLRNIGIVGYDVVFLVVVVLLAVVFYRTEARSGQ